MNARNILRVAIAVGALAYFAYAQFKPKGDAAHSEPAAPIAANAKAFTLGQLEFKACELKQKKSGATTSAFCAPLRVPENRAETHGRQIDLRLALVKSEAVVADRDIVVYLAGGPGQSAIDTWPQLAPALAPLRKHHHVLLLDQRGTGGSNPLTCKGSADEAAADSFDIERLRKATGECLAAIGDKADPRFYTTTEAVADLEAVRAALGNPQFDLIGVSYGTRMAQQYAMRHADGVRSVVLDSVAPNELMLGADFAANLESALKAQFSHCSAAPACAKAYTDPYASLRKLRDNLRTKPEVYDYRDPVSFAATTRRLNEYVGSPGTELEFAL